MASSAPSAGLSANMNVDYVVSYRFAQAEKAQAISQFQNLVQALSAVGLSTEVRNGEKHSVLVFVRLASEQHLWAEVYRSRTKDWLHGVRSSAPDKDVQTTEDKQPLYPAERLRIVYQLITNPTEEGGAGITPKHGEWKYVESVFALHDHEYNKKWLKKWATQTTLKAEDLDQIRDRLGEKVAFYFAFTQSYFSALILIAGFGASAWVVLGYYSSIYGIVNSLLCVAFVEYWKHQEYDLAVRWGVRHVSSIENKRHGFQAEKEVTDPLTGEKVQVFPHMKRFQRQLLAVPFAIVAALVLGALIATSFGIEIFMSEIYKGPGQSILVFLPTGIMTTMQPLVLGFLTNLAERLTKYENYKTDAAYEKAMTQKIFVLNFITSYLPIFLTAFVYVPFASVLVPYLDVFNLTVKPLTTDEKQTTAPPVGFTIDQSRLRKQVIYFTVTAQIVNQLMEIVLPYFKRKGFSEYKKMQSKRAAKAATGDKNAEPDVAANDPPEEKAFLKRVREEAELDVYDVNVDLREMVVQYGYLALFSAVWPLTGASFLVNNWLELRTDAAKICLESQRPTPWRADSIGPWLDSLGFLTWLGSITTSAIIYMFKGDGGTGPGGNPNDIKLWGLLLAVFTSEHTYLLAQWAVRIGISKIDSPGRRKERAEKYMVRKKYLEESLGVQAGRSVLQSSSEKITRTSLEEQARNTSAARLTAEEQFWSRQQGWQDSAKIGQAFIERAAMQEGKKVQ